METNSTVPGIQAGFRKDRCTADNLFILNYAVQIELAEDGGKDGRGKKE